MTFEYFNTKFHRDRWKQKQPFIFWYCVDNFYPWKDIVRKKVSKLWSIAKLRAFYGKLAILYAYSRKFALNISLNFKFSTFFGYLFFFSWTNSDNWGNACIMQLPGGSQIYFSYPVRGRKIRPGAQQSVQYFTAWVFYSFLAKRC